MTDPRASRPPFGTLFDREPRKWGLRGDVQLWRRMRERFADTPMPGTEWTVEKLIDDAFEAIVGKKLDHELVRTERVFVKTLSIGSGMSDGNVMPSWWDRTAKPLIIDRWQALS